MSLQNNIDQMIEELVTVNNLKVEVPTNPMQKEQFLKSLMTISIPYHLSDRYYELEAEYYNEVNLNKTIVDVEAIDEKLIEQIYLFKGDITTIKADLIVNAANEKMLGCFIPGHKCIDNAIHMAAGLHLRNACYDLMKLQGHDEPVGQVKITEGFHLPSKYVAHTVGPNLNANPSMTMDMVKQELKSCYVSILEEANQYDDIKSIVFCSISTGVYGVPIEVGAEVALESVKEYLKTADHHIDKVIMNVFSEGDYHVYKNTAKRIEP